MAVKAAEFDVGPVSSYAIAVEHGYTGTEAQWIALIQAVTSNAELAAASSAAAVQARDEVIGTQASRLRELNETAENASREAQTLHNARMLELQNVASDSQAAAEAAQASAEAAAEAIENAQNAAEAAQTQVENLVATIPPDYSELSAKVLLEMENIPGTTQTPVFEDGILQRIEHKNASQVNVRVDVFTMTDESITESRTLSSGENMTIVTTLSTVTTVTTYTGV